MDTASSGFFAVEDQQLQNPYDVNGSRSVSGFDIPHFFSFAAVYQLPFGHTQRWLHSGALSRVLGHWQVNAIYLGRSGTPFTPVTNLDIANIGGQNPASRVRPNLLHNPQLANSRPAAWFDRTAYTAPAAITFGSAGRNQLRADRLDNLDFALFREDRWAERLQTQLRLELFNALNHATFATPQTLLSSPVFGQVTSAGAGRQVQLALKIVF